MIAAVASLVRESAVPGPGTIDGEEILVENTSKAAIVYFLDPRSGRPLVVAKISHDGRFDATLRTEGETMRTLRSAGGPDSGIPAVFAIAEVSGRTVVIMEPAGGRNLATDLHPWNLRPDATRKRHLDSALGWLLRFRAAHGTGGGVPVHGDFGPRNIHADSRGNVSVVDWEYYEESGAPHHDPCHFALIYTWLARTARGEVDPASAWETCLPRRDRLGNAIREFLRKSVPDCSDGAGIARALGRYGEESFAGRNHLALDPVLQEDPDRWDRLLRAIAAT